MKFMKLVISMEIEIVQAIGDAPDTPVGSFIEEFGLKDKEELLESYRKQFGNEAKVLDVEVKVAEVVEI